MSKVKEGPEWVNAQLVASRLARVGAWHFDGHTRSTWFSDETLQIFGVEEPPSVEDGIQCFEPEYRETISNAFQEVLESGRGYDLELPFVNAKRERLWVRTMAERGVDPATGHVHVHGAMQDITERKNRELLFVVEQTLRQKEGEGDVQASLGPLTESLRLLRVPHSHVIYVPLQSERKSEVGFWSESGGEWMPFLGGGTPSEPQIWVEVQDGSLPPERWRALAGLIPVQGPEKAYCVQVPGALLWIGMAAAARLSEFERVGLLAIARNLVRLQTALAERDRARALDRHLQQSQRMEAIGRLAGGVAHDFNNLLMVIRATCEVRSMTGTFGPEDISTIDAAASHGQELTQELLDFSRSEPTTPTVMDLNKAVLSTSRFLERLVGEDINIESNLRPQVLPVTFQKGQLERVIMNIAINARDAMPDGGTLTFATREVCFVEQDARRPIVLTPGRYALVSIKDTGIGMSEELKETIFEPFMTTKKAGEGTGLGLAMAHGAVKRFDGHIQVESEPGRGTQFTLYLPLAEHAPSDSVRPGASLQSHRVAGKALVVEDEPTVRRIAAEMLEAWGFQVLAAEGLHEAERLLSSFTGRLDLLLTDVIMPQGNGVAVARAVRRQCGPVPVIFMSGHVRVQEQEQLRNTEESSLLQKPFSSGELFEHVSLHLDKKRVSTLVTGLGSSSI